MAVVLALQSCSANKGVENTPALFRRISEQPFKRAATTSKVAAVAIHMDQVFK
jgi:hypothetical protein